MNIAFHMMGGSEWTVGENFLNGLFHAVKLSNERDVRLFLICLSEEKSAHDYANSIRADGIIHLKIPKRLSLSWSFNYLTKRLLFLDESLEICLQRSGVDAVFGVTPQYRFRNIATLSWIPDFQFLHFPEMFDEKELGTRKYGYLRSANLATRILLMSMAVEKDFKSFAPMHTNKVRVLHPVSSIPQSIYETDVYSIMDQYHLPEKFVFLPNQFWKHKNHEVVFDAMKLLKDEGFRTVLVCTGNPVDHRHPSYFSDLFKMISKYNMRDQVIYLGLIPYEHVLALMRQSICVINPSIFEGWGMTIDEARSVGKQVLLSDIPAHREQNPPKATYFNPNDCESLSEKIHQIWKQTSPGPDLELETEARHGISNRQFSYGQRFMSVVHEAVEEISR